MSDGNQIHPDLAMTVEIERKTTTKHEGHLNGSQLRHILGLPDNARISVQVPGGGDWSHTTLSLDDGHTLDIYWEVTE